LIIKPLNVLLCSQCFNVVVNLCCYVKDLWCIWCTEQLH